VYEETIYVLAGRGAITLWYDGMKKPPSSGRKEVCLLYRSPAGINISTGKQINLSGMLVLLSSLCISLTLFHNKNFIYNNNFHL
jgi:hypothetical protein